MKLKDELIKILKLVKKPGGRADDAVEGLELLFNVRMKEYALEIVGDNEKRCSDGDVCAVARNLLRIEQREKIKGGK